MTKSELREKLHEYIDVADEKHLKAIYTLVGKEISSGYVYDEETLKELDRRREQYMQGSGESYTAEESIEMIRKSVKQKEIGSGYVYDEETLKELDRRVAEHKAGKGESYTAEESIEMLRKLKK